MKKMSKTEKTRKDDGYGNTVDSDELTFQAAYQVWETKCKGLSAKDIQSEGKEKGRTTPPNLFLQLQEHVTAAYRRPESKNDGSKGVYKLLEDVINSLKNSKLFTEEEEKNLEKFKKNMRVFNKSGGKLNPSNTVFTRPKGYEESGGKVVSETEAQINIYGHYVDEYFIAKYPKKKYKVVTGWSSREKNVANPPYKQALFGGPLIEEGLMDIIETALKELKNKKINLYTIGIKRASALARLPSVKKWVMHSIKSKQYYPENSGKINIRAISNALLTQEFTVKNEAEQRVLEIAATNKEVHFAQTIVAFKVGQISPRVMTTLIREVISRGAQEHIKVKNGYYLQMKELSDPPSDTWKEIKKSWMQHLWA